MFQSLIHYILVEITTFTSNMNVNLHYLNILIVIVLVILLAIHKVIWIFLLFNLKEDSQVLFSDDEQLVLSGSSGSETHPPSLNFFAGEDKNTHISSSSEADSESDSHSQSLFKKK